MKAKDERNDENNQKAHPKDSEKRKEKDKQPAISKIYKIDRWIICISKRS